MKAYVGNGIAGDFYRAVAGDAAGGAAAAAGVAGSVLGDIGRMFARLTDAHARRMAALELDA